MLTVGQQGAVDVAGNQSYHGDSLLHLLVSWYSDGDMPTSFLNVAEK